MTTEQETPQPPSPPTPAPAGHRQGHRHRRRRRGFSNNNGRPKNRAPENGEASPAKPVARHKQNPGRFHARNPNGNGNGNGNGNAIGNGNGAGRGPRNGRRKNKQRRQQVFVGPMDHSYRAVNGNLADSPSTIALHSDPHSGYYSQDLLEPAPVPVREDAPIRIFCFIEDLFFLAKIQETARKLGVKVGFVKAEKDIVARLADVPETDRPSLIVFDLNNSAAKPLTLIPRIKAKLKKGTSVVGFLSHLQSDLKAKALDAGCDMVMPRSAFSQNLPSLLRRHGLTEELEPVEA